MSTSKAIPKLFWVAIAAIAIAIAAIQLPRAYVIYFHRGPFKTWAGQIDSHYRWQEVQYVLRRKNPFDVAFAHSRRARAFEPTRQAGVHRPSGADADLGIPEGVGYPPWAYPTEFLFFWPKERSVAMVYYACIMAVGLGFLFWWARSEAKAGDLPMWIAVGFATLAAGSWVSAIVSGNNPPIVVPMVIGCYCLLMRGKDALAGVMLGMALLKPTVAGPFALVLLLQRRRVALVAALTYTLLASLVTWRLTATDPLEMLEQMFAASRQWVDQGFGPVQYLIHAGVAPQVAGVAGFAIGSALGCLVLFLARGGTLLAQFSIAAIIARFWSYHLYYDDAIIVFALVFFARETLGTRAQTAAIAFGLTCVGLWMPYRLTLFGMAQVVQLLIWLAAAYFLVHLSRPDARALPVGEQLAAAR